MLGNYRLSCITQSPDTILGVDSTQSLWYRIHPGGYQLDPADGDFTENQMASTQRAGETGRGHETGFPLLGWLEGDLVRR